MKEFESANVLVTDAAGLGWLEIRPGRAPGAEEKLPRSLAGERGSRLELFKICQKGDVYNAHTFDVGPGRTGAGLARIRYISSCL
jgi:hypothetical protein